MTKHRVLFTFPTAWDLKQLEACRSRWESQYEVLFGDPDDVGCPWDFDIVGYLARAVEEYRDEIDGVTSSSDYPGATVAAAMAMRLGLPGSRPDTIIRCSHKYYSRLAQRAAVPEATPAFHLIDPSRPGHCPEDIAFPCFIKPVKGAFSVMTKKLGGPADLRFFLERPAVAEFIHDYVAIFNELVAALTDFDVNGSFFLVEDFLHGVQATVEGFEWGGTVEILGIVDSVFQPGTGSFARFDYPSGLRAEIQDRMGEIAKRAVRHLGLSNSLFNIEMIYEPATDTIRIIEINPRLCGQFADLYQKVDGTNGYEVALALATGTPPPRRRGQGRFSHATSFPLRTYVPVRVDRAPTIERIAEVEARDSGAIVWWECEEGQELADFERLEDGESVRYGVVNVGADSRAGLLDTLERVRKGLDYRLTPL